MKIRKIAEMRMKIKEKAEMRKGKHVKRGSREWEGTKGEVCSAFFLGGGGGRLKSILGLRSGENA